VTACLIVACQAKDSDEISTFLWARLRHITGIEEAPTLESSLFQVPKEYDVLEFGSAAAEKFSKWLGTTQATRGQIFLKAYLEALPERGEQLQVESELPTHCSLVAWTQLAEQDYVAKFREHFRGSFTPSRRVWVGPEWQPKPNCEMALIVEPGMAFGTGDHPTTQLCLDRILEYSDQGGLKSGAKVLDLGCGTGILGLAIQKRQPQAKCLLTDLDPLCRDQVERTFALNGASIDSITTIFGPKAALAELKEFAPFDLIVSNIYAEILAGLAPHVFSLLRPGALWLTSGILEGVAEETLKAAAIKETFICKLKRSVVKDSSETWVLLEFQKPGGKQ
jgi:ribosomal protein L11 methyltransferase